MKTKQEVEFELSRLKAQHRLTAERLQAATKALDRSIGERQEQLRMYRWIIAGILGMNSVFYTAWLLIDLGII